MDRPFGNALTELYYKEEKSPGHYLQGELWRRVRIRGESLTQTNVVNETRRMDRKRSLTNVDLSDMGVSGTLNCILSPRDLDIFLEATLCNKWTTLQLSQGEIKRTFTFLLVRSNGCEKSYSMFRGCVISTTTFNFQVNSHVGFDLTVLGRFADHNYKPHPQERFEAKPDTPFFVGLDGLMTIDGEKAAFITSFSGSFGYNYNVIKVIDPVPIRLRLSGFTADGNITAGFSGEGVYEEYLRDTSFNLTMRVQYKSVAYAFIFPRCVVTSHESPSSGVGSIIASASITPLFSQEHGSTVIVKREETA